MISGRAGEGQSPEALAQPTPLRKPALPDLLRDKEHSVLGWEDLVLLRWQHSLTLSKVQWIPNQSPGSIFHRNCQSNGRETVLFKRKERRNN